MAVVDDNGTLKFYKRYKSYVDLISSFLKHEEGIDYFINIEALDFGINLFERGLLFAKRVDKLPKAVMVFIEAVLNSAVKALDNLDDYRMGIVEASVYDEDYSEEDSVDTEGTDVLSDKEVLSTLPKDTDYNSLVLSISEDAESKDLWIEGSVGGMGNFEFRNVFNKRLILAKETGRIYKIVTAPDDSEEKRYTKGKLRADGKYSNEQIKEEVKHMIPLLHGIYAKSLKVFYPRKGMDVKEIRIVKLGDIRKEGRHFYVGMGLQDSGEMGIIEEGGVVIYYIVS